MNLEMIFYPFWGSGLVIYVQNFRGWSDGLTVYLENGKSRRSH